MTLIALPVPFFLVFAVCNLDLLCLVVNTVTDIGWQF